MEAKKIIPCLDMKDGRIVKGIKFKDMKDIGNPPDLAKEYEDQGADEVTFLDISATLEGRKTMLNLVSETSKRLTIPLAIGGGIRSLADMKDALDAGADKVSMNSAAVKNPDVITECSEKFGKNCVIVAIDAKKESDGWKVYTHGGTKSSGIDAIEWAKKVEDLGAGEILLTSIDADGVKKGYDIPLTAAIADEVKIPVTASGGCGSVEHIYEVFTQTNVASALAASIFHYREYTVREIKEYLKDRGVKVR